MHRDFFGRSLICVLLSFELSSLPALKAHKMALDTNSAIATKSAPTSGIGGPQTREERPAAVVRERPHKVPTGLVH